MDVIMNWSTITEFPNVSMYTYIYNGLTPSHVCAYFKPGP